MANNKFYLRTSIVIFLLFLLNIYAQSDTTYTVKWTLVELLPAPCPDAQKENEYGVRNNYMSSCAVLHLRTERTEKQKEFNTEKEADRFIKEMPLEKNMGTAIGSYCENAVKLARRQHEKIH